MTTPHRPSAGEPLGTSDRELDPSAHPYLDQQQQRKRARSKKILVGLGVMVLVCVVAFLVVWANAGRWGVPMFSFTNEHGSKCRNSFTGHSCHPMTKEDVEFRSQISIPADAQLVDGSWEQTHDYTLKARLIYPGAIAPEEFKKLGETFGDCYPNLPNELHNEPGLTGICTMTNTGIGAGGDPTARIWSISTANMPDGNTAVQIDIRSR